MTAPRFNRRSFGGLFVDNGVANPSDVQFSNCDFNSNGEGDDNADDAISLERTRQ